MKRLLTVAAIAAGLTLLDAGAASAKPISPADGELSQTHSLADCGEVTITVTNTTKWLFEWTVKNVTTGESQTLAVDGRIADGPDTATVTLSVDEQTTFSYGNTAGAESDWYLAFDTVVVEPCVVVTPPPTTTVPPTTTTPPSSSSAPPTSSTGSIPPATNTTNTSSTSAVHYANCDAVKAAGKAPIRPGDEGFRNEFDSDNDGAGCEINRATGEPIDWGTADLASTGTPSVLPFVVIGGVLLLGGGGVLLYLARRRAGGAHLR